MHLIIVVFASCFSLVGATIVIAPPPNTDADTNSTVLFTCVAYGNPTPSISWYADYELLSNDTDSDTSVKIYNTVFEIEGVLFVQSVLELCGITLDDQGPYSCVAENYLNISSAEFYLNVLGKLINGCCALCVCVCVCYEGRSRQWLHMY